MVFPFRFDEEVDIDLKSRVSAVEVYYGNQANAKYSAAEVTKKRETATEFGSGTQVTRCLAT